MEWFLHNYPLKYVCFVYKNVYIDKIRKFN